MAASVPPRDSIASLRTRLVLEAPVETTDAAGGFARTFGTIDRVWGRIRAVSGSESLAGEAPGQAISHRIALRWRADITGAMRFRLGPRLLAIRATYDPDGTRQRLVCLCEEIRP